MFNSTNYQLIKWTRLSMILAGVWNSPLYENYIFQKVYKVYAVVMKCGYAVFFSSLFGEALRLIICNYEISVIISSIGVLFNATKIAVKIVIYIRFNIFQLFEEVIEKEKAVWQSENQEIIAMYKAKIRVCTIYLFILAASTFMVVVLLEISGAFATYKLIQHNQQYNDTLEPHFMYQSLFPLNKLNNISFFFVTQVFWAWLGTAFNIMTQGVFVTLLIYGASQLEILQIRMKNFVGNVETEILEPEEINEKIVILKELIQDHIHIIEFIKFVNQATKYPILLEYLLTSLDIASVSVNLIKSRSQWSWLVLFLSLLVFQISIIAWTCNEIRVQSVAIGDALYASQWYLLNKEANFLVGFVIARTQIPLSITIGPFGAMTTGSALTVFKAAYSYMTLMTE